MSLEELPILGGISTAEPLRPPPTAHGLPKCSLLSDLFHPKDILTSSTLPVFYLLTK
jgi:hypothetical protein